jgi:hypothetical protein
MLAISLTVTVYRIEPSFIHRGSDNLNTDGHRLTRIKDENFDANCTNFHEFFGGDWVRSQMGPMASISQTVGLMTNENEDNSRVRRAIMHR